MIGVFQFLELWTSALEDDEGKNGKYRRPSYGGGSFFGGGKDRDCFIIVH